MEAPQFIVYVLLIAGIIGFNLLMRYLNGRGKGWQEKLEQRQQERQQSQQATPEDLAEAAASAPWGGSSRETAAEGAAWGGSARDYVATEPIEVVLARRERAAARREAGFEAAAAALPPVRPATTQRRRTQPLFRTRADLRHAVVVMTVLGPCRVNAPYGRDDDQQRGARPRR